MSQHGCPERLSNRSKGFQEDNSTSTMEVFVETLTGTAFEMTVSPSDTIFAIKSKICRVEGIPVAQQHLVYNLREVEDGMSLGALGIGAGARLRLVLALRGGPVCTRRLPPPPPPPPAHRVQRVQRLAHATREEDWGCSSGGCKVTVLVFRDGERVNMLRVRENRDGTYTPLERAKYSSPPSSTDSKSSRESCYESHGIHSPEARHNAVTLRKMVELRARMRSLSLRRGTVHHPEPEEDIEDKPQEIQKTRSEETLSYSRLFDECPLECACACEVDCDPLCDCPSHAYTLLPPIGTRTDSEQSIQDAAESEGFKLSDALAGSILYGRRELDEQAILEEMTEGLPRDSPQLAEELATVPAAEYGPLVGGGTHEWRRGFGSHSQLSAHAHAHAHALGHAHAHAHSACSLHARAAGAARPRAPAPPPAPLSDALFSASTSDLERLTRNRLLPALSRHRNREHLHLSDEGLDAPPRAPPVPPQVPASHPPQGGSERRQRRIEKIAEMDTRFRSDFGDVKVEEPPKEQSKPVKEKKMRPRCGWCRKRLSIATVHTCRCGAEFCAPHRYAEVHGCLYDYKALAPREPLPATAVTKLPRI